jgi:hypothetical protein
MKFPDIEHDTCPVSSFRPKDRPPAKNGQNAI